MCGIAGYFGTSTLDERRVRGCLSLMGRRGPDDASYRKFTNAKGRHAYLLHSRLSIIDLGEQSNQPFEVDGHWLIFNGELYNYIELRKQLLAQGAIFRTQSDTEVLAMAVAHGGLSALDQCEGMWAFAMYDEKDGDLILCRDRFAEKPLYVYRTPDGVYFGSEAKFIFALLGHSLPINHAQIARFLVNGYKSLYKQPDTFFAGLTELGPATALLIDAMGQVEERRYWQPCFSPRQDMTYEQAVAGSRERLIEAVRLRLRSDVPMAFMMSGGVDSSTIVSIAKRVFNYDVHGFTILNEDGRYDEQAIVDGSVASLGIKHTTLALHPENFLPRLRVLVRQHDAPVYTISSYISWLLAEQIAALGYRVVFSGAGADEMFSGYYDHYLMHLSEIRDTTQYGAAVAAWTRHVKPVVRNPFLSNPHLFDDNVDFRDHIFLKNDQMAQYLTGPFAEGFSETCYSGSLLRNRMMNEMFHEGTRVILHEDDLNTMYFSMENRAPFLDRKLFDFCYSIPNRHLIQDGFNKSVLRDAVREIVPDCVVNQRRKVGFNAPILSFLDNRDPKVLDELQDDSPIFNIVRRDKIRNLLKQQDLPNSASKFLFYFVSAKTFLEEFSQPGKFQ